MRSESTGQLVPARCNSYVCPDCSPLFQMTARHAIEWGLTVPAIARRSEAAVFITLTEPGTASLDFPGLCNRWQATVKRLRRSWGLTEYAMVTEFQQRGALHPHVFALVHDQVVDDLRDRSSRASYRRRMHELRPMAEALGWGQMVDAITPALGDVEKMGRYGAKAISGYATKEAAEKFKRAGAQRVRPLRLSRRWYPGGLAAAREAVLGGKKRDRDPGPWTRIASVGVC